MRVYKPKVPRPLPRKHEVVERDGKQFVVIRRGGEAVEFPLTANGKKYVTETPFYWGEFRNIVTNKIQKVPLKTEHKPTALKMLREHVILATQSARENPHADAERVPLERHIADFEGYLKRNNTPKHVKLWVGRIRRMVQDCGFVFWRDITPERVGAFLDDLASQDVGIQTCNYYLQALKQFCRWATLREPRFARSPVAHLQGGNVRKDRRRDRRALLPDELLRLIQVTESGPERVGLTGRERGMLYQLAVTTGLRLGEITSLNWTSFEFSGDTPCVTVSAAYAKNGRSDKLPLLPEVAGLLREWRRERNAEPGATRVFALPFPTTVPKMLRADLAAARDTWINESKSPAEREKREKSDFLMDRNEAGQVVDFHALRHTFITNLARGGVAPKVAQDLARHSDINLTLSRYSHTVLEDRASALRALPSLKTGRAAAKRQRAG